MSRSLRPHHFLSFLAAGFIIMFGSSDLAAQRFQYTCGGSCQELGYRGVHQIATGGYIAVGVSTPLPCTSGSDVYVVRTNINGTLQWSQTYDLGGDETGYDIIEDGGNFVICGSTVSGGQADIFLLKITATGAVIASQLYGVPGADDEAFNLVKAQAGDYIVAGYTTGTNQDGLILRVAPSLNQIWSASYDLTGSWDQSFSGVIETQVQGVGDIVVVGQSTTLATMPPDLFVVRVNGGNGSIGGTLQGAALYGATAATDIGRAVIEVPIGTSAGNIVIAGQSSSRPAPSTNSEILMLRLGPNPCTFLAGRFAGDNGPGPDEAHDLKWDPWGTNHVIVTGAATVTGATDAFLQLFAVGGALLPSGPGMLYGGNGPDIGTSVTPCQNIGAGQTQGYAVCGTVGSPNITSSQDLYLIKTSQTLTSGCNEMPITFNTTTATLTPTCVTLIINNAFIQLSPPTVVPSPAPGPIQLCYFPSTRQQDNGGNDGVAGIEASSVLSFNEGTVISYPNPMASGEELHLRFDLAAPATATITVSDMVGRVLYRNDAPIERGSKLHAIETTGWSAGSYLVRITIGEQSSTARVVILDR